MSTLRKTSVLTVGLALVLALMLGVVAAFGLSGVANAVDEPPSEQGVTPKVEDGNPNCATLNASPSYPNVTSDLGFKIDANPSGGQYSFFNGTQNGDKTELQPPGAPSDPSNSVNITPTAFESGSPVPDLNDTTKFEWTSTIGIDAVIVKAQDGYVYVYVPEDKADGGLQAPELKAISHVDFCYDYDLSASKTANAQYTRTYDWTIDKSVSPASHSGFAGDSFSSDYDVVVDQKVADSDFAVSGKITVNNPTPFTVSFSVADSVGGNSTPVTCPTTTLDPGASTTCDYSAALNSKTDGTNTATITSSTSGVGGASASANYAFGDPTTIKGHPTINVTDSHKGNLGSASDDKTFEYSRNFSCSNNPADYTNGVDSDTYPNTATIVETGQSDNASVKVDCVLPAKAKVVKTTTEGPENIGELPFTFKLYNPSGTLVETKTLNGAGNITFDADLKAEGTWKIKETLPSGWVSSTPLECTFSVAYPGSAGSTPECKFDNKEMSRAKLIKKVNGAPPAAGQTFTFELRQGASITSPGTTLETKTTDSSGNISFDTLLEPGKTYQICEWVLPGWNTNLSGDGLFVPNSMTSTAPPLPNPDVNNMTVCTNFTVGAGQTRTFNVDNTPPPGGRALTIGFWKNWASCASSAGKGQKPMLDLAIGIASTSITTNPPGGLVVSAQNPGSGWPNYATAWYLVLKGDPASTINNIKPAIDCSKAVNLLNKSTIGGPNIASGKKMSSDPLFNMTAQLVAAQLNRFMGAGISGITITNIQRAVLLNGKYQFNGNTYTPKLTTADTNLANCLATQLDNYNNDRSVSQCT